MVLLYDGQCPFCCRYSRYVGSRLKVKLRMLGRNPRVSGGACVP